MLIQRRMVVAIAMRSFPVFARAAARLIGRAGRDVGLVALGEVRGRIGHARDHGCALREIRCRAAGVYC
jgi:hypothetical protein